MTLSARNLVKVFSGLRAVDGFSIDVEKGEVVGLIGPNGAGKTTSFNLLNGQLRPTSGQVSLDGVVITGTPPWKLAKLGVARTFQQAASFPRLTVLENLDVALAALGTVRRSERRRKTEQVLSRIAPDAPPHGVLRDLPYGVQRRIAIAIAIANDPQYLMLDEPAAGLNPAESAALGELIRQIASSGVGVLLVEHDLELVNRVVHRVEVMAAGRPLFSGTAAEAMRDPGVLEAYIGRRGAPNA